MMTNFELMNKAREHFESYCKLFEIESYEEVDMMWGAKKGVWGTAHYNKKHLRDAEYNYIELNLQKFRCNPNEMRETIAHEVVHMYLFFKHGYSVGHSREFKETMYKLGFRGMAGKAMRNKKPIVGMGHPSYA